MMTSSAPKISSSLILIWVNAPSSADALIYLPVQDVTNCLLSQYLEDIFKITINLTLKSDPTNLQDCVFEYGLVQLFRNETLLTRDEYNAPVEYYLDSSEGATFFLNTRHCGRLVVLVTNATKPETSEPQPIFALGLDYGRHTFKDIKQKIQGETKMALNYIFTNSELCIHPEEMQTADNLKVRQLEQFTEIKWHSKKYPSEIGVTIVFSPETKPHLPVIIYFLDSKISVLEAKKLLQPKAGIDYSMMKLIYEDVLSEDERTLSSYGLKDGSLLSVDLLPSPGCKAGSGKGDFRGYPMRTFHDRFADLSENVESIPKGKVKYEEPSKGLNLQGECVNSECKLCVQRTQLIVPWPNLPFDLKKDASQVNCPKCLVPMKVLAPLFYQTQWKYFGRKIEELSDNDAGVQIPSAPAISCDWQTADDPDNSSGFTVLDDPNFPIGLVKWGALVIITRPLLKKKDRIPLVDLKKIGFSFSIPTIFSISFSGDWFRMFE